ncbi:MAG: chromate transporter, partial [Deltaproteobacteria bacterium]|nr:chromate transporter [Deltaproteobacteria bacterium]
MKAPTLREISAAFLYLGISAFGGLAMIEPVRRRVVEGKGWLSQAEFLDGLALCQMAPGATVVQLAAYAGYRLRGLPGALAAAAGFILPAFFLMLGLSFCYFRYGNIAWVQAVSRGLGALVIALLLQTTWRLGRAICRHWSDYLITLLALAAFWGRISYFLVFLAAGLAKLVLQWRFFFEASEAEKAGPGRKPGWGRGWLQ